MRTLKNILLGALVGTGLALAASSSAPVDDQQLAAKVSHEIRMYPYYSIWDNLSFRVAGGNVELLGDVNQPFKKADLQRIVQHVSGVTSVTNEVKVLPLSNFDDQLRLQVARAIFRDPVLSQYALQHVSPIHIIVDNGHVALEGVVRTETEKNIAGIRANGAGLSFGSVVNNLRVEQPSPKHVS